MLFSLYKQGNSSTGAQHNLSTKCCATEVSWHTNVAQQCECGLFYSWKS